MHKRQSTQADYYFFVVIGMGLFLILAFVLLSEQSYQGPRAGRATSALQENQNNSRDNFYEQKEIPVFQVQVNCDARLSNIGLGDNIQKIYVPPASLSQNQAARQKQEDPNAWVIEVLSENLDFGGTLPVIDSLQISNPDSGDTCGKFFYLPAKTTARYIGLRQKAGESFTNTGTSRDPYADPGKTYQGRLLCIGRSQKFGDNYLTENREGAEKTCKNAVRQDTIPLFVEKDPLGKWLKYYEYKQPDCKQEFLRQERIDMFYPPNADLVGNDGALDTYLGEHSPIGAIEGKYCRVTIPDFG